MSPAAPEQVSPATPTEQHLADRVADLERLVDTLTATVASLAPAVEHGAATVRAVDRPATATSAGAGLGPTGTGSADAGIDRRRLFGRLGAAAAVGAGVAMGAGALGATPAAAANFDPVLAGTDASATNTTGFDSTSTFATMVVKHQVNSSATALYVGRGGATNNGQAIYCNSDSNHADASSLDVRMGSNGALGSAISAFNNGSGLCLEARANGPVPISTKGARAAIRLDPLNATGPAPSGAKGEVRVDSKVSMYLCTSEAIPGIVTASWRRVIAAAPGYDNGQHAASVGSSGSLNLLASPFRLLDTRAGQPAPVSGTGKLAPSTNFDLQVTNVAPVGGGQRVPLGAIGAMVGLTVTNTGGPGGYLKAFPTGTAVPNTSVLNWFGAGQQLAVTTFVRLDAAGKMTLRTGTAATDVVVDVVGFLY